MKPVNNLTVGQEQTVHSGELQVTTGTSCRVLHGLAVLSHANLKTPLRLAIPDGTSTLNPNNSTNPKASSSLASNPLIIPNSLEGWHGG